LTATNAQKLFCQSLLLLREFEFTQIQIHFISDDMFPALQKFSLKVMSPMNQKQVAQNSDLAGNFKNRFFGYCFINL